MAIKKYTHFKGTDRPGELCALTRIILDEAKFMRTEFNGQPPTWEMAKNGKWVKLESSIILEKIYQDEILPMEKSRET